MQNKGLFIYFRSSLLRILFACSSFLTSFFKSEHTSFNIQFSALIASYSSIKVNNNSSSFALLRPHTFSLSWIDYLWAHHLNPTHSWPWVPLLPLLLQRPHLPPLYHPKLLTLPLRNALQNCSETVSYLGSETVLSPILPSSADSSSQCGHVYHTWNILWTAHVYCFWACWSSSF